MILVTGATGTIGRELVRLLAGEGRQVRAMTRQPTPAPPFPAGVDVVRADFADPDALARAVAGVRAVFLLSPPGPWVVQHDAAVLAAARAADVRTVVKLSAIGTGDDTLAKGGDWHLPGERAVRDSGLGWTVLRPSSFASNALQWVRAIRAGAPVPNPMGAGTQGVVDPLDVAEVAAKVLTGTDHAGQVYTLTGPELLSVPDQVERLGQAVGRLLTTAELTPTEYAGQLRAAGLDPAFVEVAVAGARLVAGGGNAVLTPDVERVTGHPPRPFTDWAGRHRAAFGAGPE
ncbi:NAD(P)H-binding protein [Streptomyces sp. 796.1]|uniref:NAD(P)H-binding protein n=1 Tax=Streptomyces sp. 796.1 TaxID=3163029 RepID=UPI0039C92810